MNHGREACIGSESVLRGEGNVREKTEYIRNVQLNMAMAHRHVTNRIDAATDARDRFNDTLLHKVSYRVGDEVYVYQLPRSDGKQDLTRKLVSPYQGPYRVVKVLNDVTYQVENIETKKKKTVHVTKMKKKHKRQPHLMPQQEQEAIPILPGALDERNQQQGDQFHSHATRRQIQRQAREKQIEQHTQTQQLASNEEQEHKYDPTGAIDAPVTGNASEDDDVSDEEEDELEEGEVVLPSNQ